MKRDFSTNVTGWAFLASALMIWGGWALLPTRLGTFFQPADFAPIYGRFHFWVWMFRVHLFGMITVVIALGCLAAVVAESPARVLIWPGVIVASAGMVVGAVAAAFYYHFGAWGALDMHDKSDEVIANFVASLKVSTEYVTCLVRFGRVFSGLGLLLVALGLLKWKLLPAWLGLAAAAIGVAAMALTMALPDHLHQYLPIFHAHCLWLAATGLTLLNRGIPTH